MQLKLMRQHRLANSYMPEFPTCDRAVDPWFVRRMTLLRDAVHSTSIGSNGASQAIMDADCLAHYL